MRLALSALVVVARHGRYETRVVAPSGVVVWVIRSRASYAYVVLAAVELRGSPETHALAAKATDVACLRPRSSYRVSTAVNPDAASVRSWIVRPSPSWNTYESSVPAPPVTSRRIVFT